MHAPDAWTARLGVLVPSTNTVLERDARTLLAPDVSAHFARMKLDRDSADPIAGLVDYAASAAELLADAGVGAIAFGCTTGSLVGGLGYDRHVIELIEDATGVPATTTATAVIEALAALHARRVALVTPYDPALHRKVIEFLGANDLDVVAADAFGLGDPDEIAAVAPAVVAEAIEAVDVETADAVFVSCTALRAVDALRVSQPRTTKPIITSNQATYWQLNRMARDRATLSG